MAGFVRSAAKEKAQALLEQESRVTLTKRDFLAFNAATGRILMLTVSEDAIASLSPRERDILRGIARGASNKEIARENGIVETTVKIHVQHILRKLDVSSRVHAAVIATEHGLL